ncbi:hypothetical protein KI387_004209, partial [Taxus chinensis]
GKRDMAFCGEVTQSRLKIIFRDESTSIMEAISRILGEEYLAESNRSHVKSEVASWFVMWLLLVKQNIAEARCIALHFIKLMHRVHLVEALEEFSRTQPLPDSVRDGHALEEARQVIAELLAHNLVMLRFTKGVHVVCEEGNTEGKILEKMDLSGLSAPIFTTSAGIAGL